MTMLIHIQFKTTGSSFWRGRSSRVVDLAGSMPSALDGGRSVTNIRNNFCRGVLMTGMPVTMQKKICITSAMCTDMMKATNFWMPD